MTAQMEARVPLDPALLAALRQQLRQRLSTSAAVCAFPGSFTYGITHGRIFLRWPGRGRGSRRTRR
jgi:hypothetical protein